jgi:rRNA maturation endonuclease Nob1
VESSADRPELVRCVACQTVYELAPPSAQTQADATGCPDCGGVQWLADSVPVAETATSSPE